MTAPRLLSIVALFTMSGIVFLLALYGGMLLWDRHEGIAMWVTGVGVVCAAIVILVERWGG